MIRLTRVELRRLVARRLTVIGVAALAFVIGLMMFATWRSARPLTEAEVQQARVQYEQAHDGWVRHGAEWKKQCEEDYKSAPEPKAAVEEYCAYPEPKLEDFGRPQVTFAESMAGLLLDSSYLLAFAAFLIGASFVGAEFSSGSIGNWLTFEPRRLRVYTSKLAGAAIGLAPVAAVALALLVGGTYLIIDQVGGVAATTGEVWGDIWSSAGRSVVLAAVAAALGGVAGLLLRHTAAAIGVAMGYLVLVEGVFGGFLAQAQPWLIRLNLDAWIKYGTTYWVEKCQTAPDGSYNCNSIEETVSFGHGAWYLAVLAAVLVALGAAVFARRDVT